MLIWIPQSNNLIIIYFYFCYSIILLFFDDQVIRVFDPTNLKGSLCTPAPRRRTALNLSIIIVIGIEPMTLVMPYTCPYHQANPDGILLSYIIYMLVALFKTRLNGSYLDHNILTEGSLKIVIHCYIFYFVIIWAFLFFYLII